MALTVIKPSGIETSGNYTVNGMNVSANASVANLSVTNSANLGAVGNVIITGGTNGYVLQTDGSGTLSWVAQSGGGSTSNISNGNSNVNIPSANGNINFSAVGNTVMVISGTGVNVAGTLNTGSGVITGNGNGLSSLVGANVTGQVANSLIAGTVYTNAQPNITSVGTLTSLTVTGNVTGGNLVTAGKVYASEMLDGGTGIYLSAGPAGYINFFTTGGDKATITDTGNIVASNVIANSTIFSTTANISANVNAGNANLGNLVTANFFSGAGNNLSNIQAANISGQVANALVSGTVYTNAQPNITSVGTLTSLSVTGNISAGNANLGNNASANFFTGNGIYLTGITTAGLSNGNSNVNIPSANGNVNISAVGNANVLVITGTGANISGTANITGNLVAGNISAGTGTGGNITGANLVSANFFTGTLTTAAQPNITSVGTLTSLSVTGNITGGNANLGNAAIANFFIGSGNNLSNIQAANISGQVANALISGTVYTNAQPNITSVGTLTDISVSGNGVFGGNLTVNGTLTYINSTTLSISDPIINLQTGPNGAAPVANTGKDVGTALNYYDTSAKIAWMGWDVSNAEISFGSNVSISSEVVTFTELANIRSGNASLGNNVAANFFIGSGNNLSNIQASNITGQVANALISGTVYTNAQPNITSVGSLTGLTVSNATGIVDFTTTANVTLGAVANLHISGGTNGYVLSTDGSSTLSWVAQSGGGSTSNISNGNSNVSIPSANGNINFSAVGNANVVVITGTGANISGTANITGNVALSGANVSLGNISNLHITGGSNTYVLSTDGSGNLSWSSASGTNIAVDDFTGNGVQTAYTLTATPANINYTLVSIAGTFQPRTVYSLTGNVITFSSAPPNTAPIEVTTFTTGSGGGGGGITAQDLLSPFLLMGA